MDNLISQLENIPLDGDDLETMANSLGVSRVSSIMYSQLKGKSLEDLFSGSDAVFILYEIKNKDGRDQSKNTVGHWILLVNNDKGVSYYDPYGLSISQDLHITGEPDFYSQLFKNTKVDVNDKRHQKFRDDVNTCGRHCVGRSIFWFMTNKEYDSLVLKPIISARMVSTLDVYVSILTAFLDKSDKVVLSFFKDKVSSHFST